MNKQSINMRLLNAATKGALWAVALQLSLGSVAIAAGDHILMNTTLPVPDSKSIKVSRVDRAGKNVTGTPGATAVALRFFGKKQDPETQATTTDSDNSARTDGTAGAATIDDAPAMTTAGPLRPAISTDAKPKTNTTARTPEVFKSKILPPMEQSAPQPEPKLETGSSWLEEALESKSATTTPNTVKPVAQPVELRGPVSSETATETKDNAATANAGVEINPAANADSTAATAAEATASVSPAEAVFKSPLEAKQLVKPESSMALLPLQPAPPLVPAGRGFFARAPIHIDNDEIVEQEATLEYEEMPLDDETKTKVKAGARFPIVITSEINSRTAKKGDAVHGRLKYDLKIGDRLVAQKGAVVRGHLNYALPARTPMASMLSTNRWYRNSGCLGVQFDEIINDKNEHIPLVAEPARQALYVKNKAEGRVLGINHKGQIAGPWSQQLRYKAIRVGLNFALAPAGVMSFGAMPVALGVIGAVNPSFAFMKPVGTNVRHRRIKGFAWGFLSGVPGSWLIEDTTVKGQEAVIKPGDEFFAEMRQEFTGEPASDAEMLGGANTKVQGEIVNQKGAKKKKK